MRNLESAGGGIVQGLILLLHELPKRPPEKNLLPGSHGFKESVLDGWTKLDPVQVTAVRALYEAVARRQQQTLARDNQLLLRQGDSQNKYIDKVQKLQGGSTVDRFHQECEDGNTEDGDAEDIAWVATRITKAFDDDSKVILRTQRLNAISEWSRQGETDMVYEYELKTTHDTPNIKLCYVQITLRASLMNLRPGPIVIEIKLAGEGKTHENVFAEDALETDPARRIAFQISGTSWDGQPISYYPSVGGDSTVFRVNALADKILNGDKNLSIARRPRRFVYLEARSKEQLPLDLRHLHQGGYTSEMVKRSCGRSKKKQRE